MTRITPAAVGSNVYERAMGHRPQILENWFRLDATMRFGGTLDPSLKEEVRRVLADGVGCTYCSSLGRPDPTTWSARTALAVGFAQVLWEHSTSLSSVDDTVFTVLAEEFDEGEIVELTCWVLFLFAAQGFGAVMHLPPATDDELAGYQDWRRAAVVPTG